MTSKLNIFNSLPQHQSDSEDEVTSKNAKTKVKHEKHEKRVHETEKNQSHGHPAPRDPAQKEDVARQKAQHKQKGVPAEPHPNDRHSGSNVQAYGAKPKKSGTGKGNWGSYKEDKKAEEGEEGEEAQVQEEEKPEGRTLAEYLSSQRGAQSGPQLNETKAKITTDQLMKEVGKATLLKTRAAEKIDDKNAGKKKDRLNVDHHAGLNSEHANLLNFRTGFVEKEYKERSRDDAGAQPRRFGGNRGERREGNKDETQPQTETVEGETPAPVEGQAEAQVEGQAPAETQGQEKRQEGERRQGQGQGQGHRGSRGGYRGDRGDRPQGERRNYGGGKGNTTKVNVEDESAFPKLG